MQFSSVRFLLFLLICVILYYALRPRYRNYLLLAASYYFYFSFKAEYLAILLVSTLVNYTGALGMEKRPGSKKLLLGWLLFFNLGILFFFKYFNFAGDQLNALFRTFSLNLSIPSHSLILPVGISFYTFMALGYVLDVYWGDLKAQRSYLTYSIYMAFFPQILCGPIGRAKNLFPQHQNSHSFSYNNFSNGFRLMLWGFFKKIVIADNLGLFIDSVYGNIGAHSTLTIISVIALYPLQLYTDFSGYTDIARGIAKLFSYDLMENFRTPYVNSLSVTDYWHRNHISLTSWIRDYVFYPFIGSSTSKMKIYLGLILMFLASGIWHGASWMFIIWGFLQAVYLIWENLTGIHKTGSKNILVLIFRRCYTYILIAISLLFFRASPGGVIKIFNVLRKLDFTAFGHYQQLFYGLLGLVVLILLELKMDKKQFDAFAGSNKPALRLVTYQILILSIIILGNLEGQAFVYMEF